MRDHLLVKLESGSHSGRMRLTLSPTQHARLLGRLPEPNERRAIRIRAGLSMRNVADDLGVTSTAVRLWEVGERNVSPEYLERYVAMLTDLVAQERDTTSSGDAA